jgi:hypothetical protein
MGKFILLYNSLFTKVLQTPDSLIMQTTSFITELLITEGQLFVPVRDVYVALCYSYVGKNIEIRFLFHGGSMQTCPNRFFFCLEKKDFYFSFNNILGHMNHEEFFSRLIEKNEIPLNYKGVECSQLLW